MNSVNFHKQPSLYQWVDTSPKHHPQPSSLPIANIGRGQETRSPKKNWHERAISHLNKFEKKIDAAIPNLEIQNKIDAIGRHLQKKFAPLGQFNQWLDDNGHGAWYDQLATFLVLLPARAVRNIIRLIYQVIKGLIYSVVHPLKALSKVAKLLVTLVHELTKPETWSKLGVGMIGASLGQALVTGNPFSVIGLGIGGALTVAGLTGGALKAAIRAQKGFKLQAVKHNLFQQAKQLPEVMLTGFAMGLIIGGIQMACETRTHQIKVSSPQDTKQFVDQFVKDNNLPQPDYYWINGDKISIQWSGWNKMQGFVHKNPNYFTADDWYPIKGPMNIRMDLQPRYSSMTVKFNVNDGFEGRQIQETVSLNNIGINGRMYPAPAEETIIASQSAAAIGQHGSVAGTAAVFQSHHGAEQQ